MEQKSLELQKIGSHTLEVINESQNVVVDTALIERRETIANTVNSLKSQLQSIKNGMSDEQTAIFKAELEEIRGEKVDDLEEPGFSVKFVILGVLVGIFLTCAWIICKMLFAVKLQEPGEVRSMFGIRLFGEISISSEKKRFLSVIDKWILAIKNRRKKSMSMEKQIKVISANIALSCRQQGIECIYMTGSEYEKMDTEVLGKIKKELSVHGVKVKEGENIFYDAVSLQKGIEVGNILLVEQKGLSIYDEILNEINLVAEQKGNILGAVVLG